MTDPASAVALLFGDAELGGHLREALRERGARIVHEGAVSSLSRELLQRVGADVLVVNLDEGADDALDQLYEVIDGDRPRVVFNDAQASRALAGWDRARWARHLAAKVLSMDDLDPPRPEDARGVEALPAAPAGPTEPAEPSTTIADIAAPFDEPAAAGPDSNSDVPANQADDERHEQAASAESESLAAELEAMLASGELPMDDQDEAGPGLRDLGDGELPLHDGNFGAWSAPARESTAATTDSSGETPSDAAPAPMQFDHLPLSPLIEASVAAIPASAIAPTGVAAASSVRVPDSWALLDEDASPTFDARVFGVEKLSAADFLAPEAEPVVHEFEPSMSLELVSMEEAIAPQAYVQDHEMQLDEPGSALSRVVLTGAAVDGIDSACSFLSALPANMQLTFLHTQHPGALSDLALVEKFSANSALPVRLAVQGRSAEIGEVLLVPVGQQLRLRRDGSVELQPNAEETTQSVSIDASLTMAASAFGRDALAIVFAGRGNDAIAGAQAIHDRGGQVWVESSSGEHFADMVSGIFAERLVSFSGTPHELAAHLIEVFP